MASVNDPDVIARRIKSQDLFGCLDRLGFLESPTDMDCLVYVTDRGVSIFAYIWTGDDRLNVQVWSATGRKYEVNFAYAVPTNVIKSSLEVLIAAE